MRRSGGLLTFCATTRGPSKNFLKSSRAWMARGFVTLNSFPTNSVKSPGTVEVTHSGMHLPVLSHSLIQSPGVSKHCSQLCPSQRQCPPHREAGIGFTGEDHNRQVQGYFSSSESSFHPLPTPPPPPRPPGFIPEWLRSLPRGWCPHVPPGAAGLNPSLSTALPSSS